MDFNPGLVAFALVGILGVWLVFVYPFPSLCAAVTAAMIYNPKKNIGFANITVAYVFFLLLIVGAVLRIFLQRGSAKIPKSRLHRPVVILMVIVLTSMVRASFFLNEPPLAHSFKYVLFLGVMLSLIYITYLSVNTEKQLRTLSWLLLAGGTLTSVQGFITRGFSPGKLVTLAHPNPNFFGNFLTLITAYWIIMSLKIKLHPAKRLGVFLGIGIMALGIAYSLSRSSWLGLLLAGCFTVIVNMKVRYAVVFIIAGVIAWNTDFVQDKITGRAGKITIAQRQIKIQDAWKYFKERPVLGIGPGGFSHRAERHLLQMIRDHSTLENSYMALLCNIGIAGSLGLLYLLWAVFKNYRNARRSPIPTRKTFSDAAAAPLIASLGIMFGEDLVFFPANSWLCGMFIGILLAIPRIFPDNIHADQVSPFERRRIWR